MLIFNTTYLVSDKVHGAWLRWLKEQHVPFMLDCGCFSTPQIAKVLSTEADQEGTSFSVQFRIADVASLNRWNAEHGEAFERRCGEKFGADVLTFSTVLEIVE